MAEQNVNHGPSMLNDATDWNLKQNLTENVPQETLFQSGIPVVFGTAIRP
jgi:hypothetical protein